MPNFPISLRGPLALIIVDGYAHNPNPQGNAVALAKKPTFERLYKTCPWTELVTFGERVGLPDDQMGNSEVGHLNIGAGRVVEQELTRINRTVREGTVSANTSFQKIVAAAKSSGGRLHIVGLISTGGVHSSEQHVRAMVQGALELGCSEVVIHAISDGRDRPPTAAQTEIVAFEDFLRHEIPGNSQFARARIGTLCGRYFTMDRDKRWERTQKGFDLLLGQVSTRYNTLIEALTAQYALGKTDEFLEPCIVGNSDSAIKDGDAVLFTNFRADRMRQIVRAMLGLDSGVKRPEALKLSVSTMTEYEEGLDAYVLFSPFLIRNHFGNVLAHAGLSQLRIAETEKYAHVTYFFSGGNEEVLAGEERVLCPSPKDVATYDLKPEMSAHEVKRNLIAQLSSGKIRCAIVNFANCDMVGHTGVLSAAINAVETVDTCLSEILPVLDQLGGGAIITADHGNADQMIDYETGGPHTFHTKYPVPFILYGNSFKGLRLRQGGALCDIAPTACELLGLEKPAEMTGTSLLQS